MLVILYEAGLTGSKPIDSPMEQNHTLALANGTLLHDLSRYRRLVGLLMYLTITHLDICYAIHILSQFLHAPRQQHLDAAYRVLRYLKGRLGLGLIRTNSYLQLCAYCNSSWSSCLLTHQPIMGYFVKLATHQFLSKPRYSPMSSSPNIAMWQLLLPS